MMIIAGTRNAVVGRVAPRAPWGPVFTHLGSSGRDGARGATRPTIATAALALLAALAAPATAAAPKADPAGLEYFEKHVRPVLVEHCYKCHSAQAEKLKGGLRLDSREAVLKGGHTGTALLPGEPDKSLLNTALRYLDADLQMPPAK